MPEPEANRLHRGSRHHRDPALYTVVVIAVGLGLGAASGSVFGEPGTTAPLEDAVWPAVIGGCVGAAAASVVLAFIRIFATRQWPVVRPFAITAVVCALGLGALAGASTAPDKPILGELVGSGGAVTSTPTGPVSPAGVVVRVDRDDDFGADVFEGEVLLGFDVDDDGVVDGILRQCSPEPDPRVAERAGYVAIDLRCDGVVDDYLPYDEDQLLSEIAPTAVPPVRDDGIGADTLITVGLVIMLLALLMSLGFLFSRLALRQPPLARQLVPLSALTEPGEPIDVDKVADLLHASLDDVLIEADPRVAIRVAYGTLLDGLASIGLPRRPEEGPDEHIERCLLAAELPAYPIRELLQLFALARFSSHMITEAHRGRAIAAFETAIARVRRLEVVG
jgi:hypothetical protein